MAVRPSPPSRPEPLLRSVLGAVLRRRRSARGLTLQELARISGVCPQYISEVERGRKEPSSEVVAALTGSLELTLTGLLDEARELTSPAPATVTRLASRSAPAGSRVQLRAA